MGSLVKKFFNERGLGYKFVRQEETTYLNKGKHMKGKVDVYEVRVEGSSYLFKTRVTGRPDLSLWDSCGDTCLIEAGTQKFFISWMNILINQKQI